MLRSVSMVLCRAVTLSLAFALAAGSAWAQTTVKDEICVSCHAEPNPKFHSQPSHKKLACVNCHVGGAEHVADTRTRPKLGGDAALCASCHEAKKKHGASG